MKARGIAVAVVVAVLALGAGLLAAPAWADPPIVALINPTDGALVSAATDFTASAQTPLGVDSVQFQYSDNPTGGFQTFATVFTPSLDGNYHGIWANPPSAGTYYIEVVGTDKAGGVSPPTFPVKVTLDTSPPSAPTLGLSAAQNASYDSADDILWYRPGVNGSFTITATGSDPESGIASATFPDLGVLGGWDGGGGPNPVSASYVFSNGATAPSGSFDSTLINGAGLEGPATSFQINGDDTAPTIGISCDVSNCGDGSGPVNVTVNATDAGSGVGELRYTTDGSDPGPGTGTAIAPGRSFQVTSSQETVKVWGSDNVGNAAPIASQIVSGAPGAPANPCGLLGNCGFENALSGVQDNQCSANVLATVTYDNWLGFYACNNPTPPSTIDGPQHSGINSGEVVSSTYVNGGNGEFFLQDLRDAAFDPNQGFDLTAWVNVAQGYTQAELLFDWDRCCGATATAGFTVNAGADVISYGAWGQSTTFEFGTGTINWNTWHEVTLHADGATHTSTLSLDGQEVGSITTPGTAYTLDPAFAFPHSVLALGDLCGTCTAANDAFFDDVSLVQLSASGDPAQPGPTYTVNTASDHSDASGCTVADCSLREAIQAANSAGVAATIDFSIADGPQTIVLGTVLPSISVPIDVDGTSQPGVLAGPAITLDGTKVPAIGNTPPWGLSLDGDGSSVRGLVIRNFPGPGIRIGGDGATIGGRGSRAGNVVSGNQVGIYVLGDSAGIFGNLIGTNPAGTAALPNHDAGVEVSGPAAGTQVGEVDGGGNVISGNGGPGVLVDGSATGTLVYANKIGTDPNGDPADEGNGGAGVEIDSGTGNTRVGDIGSSYANRIADNAGAGVLVSSSSNPILGNSIEGNGGGGIDLDDGGNAGQPAPALATAVVADGTLSVAGTLQALVGTYRIEYFLNDTCVNGVSQGAIFAGSSQLTILRGVGALTAKLDVSNVPSGNYLTATATSAGDNTSRFSACIAVSSGGTASSATLDLSADKRTTPPGVAALPLADIPASAFATTSTDSSGNTQSAPLGSIPLGSIPLGSIPLGSIPLGSIPLGSIGFGGTTLLENGLGGVPLNTIPLMPPRSWETELRGTALEGLPVQTLTLKDVLGLSSPPADVASLGLKDIDLSLSPLGSIPLGSIALGPLPLGSIPIGGGTSESQNVSDWCDAIHAVDGFASFDCTGLGGQTVIGIALEGVPLGSIPLGSIPLGSIPLGSIPLGSIPLGSIDLADSPLGSIPLGSIPLGSIPLGSIPLGSIPLGSIPLGSIPLGSIPVLSNVVDCTGSFVCAGATLADAFAAGAIKPGATLADLGVYDDATLGDLGVYGDTTLADLASYFAAHPELTLRDLLAALMGGTPPAWEQLPLDGLQDFAGGPGASGGLVTYSADFTIQGVGDNAVASFDVAMPDGARYVPGSAKLTDDTGTTAVGDPIVSGSHLSFVLDTLAYDTSYTLSFGVRPGFELGNERATVTMSTNGIPDESAQADVTVVDTFESNNTPATGTAAAPSTLYVSYLGNGKDVDYSTIHLDPGSAPAGTRVRIFLSHLQSDADLAVFGPVDPPLRTPSPTAIPLGAIAVSDQPVAPGEERQPLAADTAQDLPFGVLPPGDRLLGVSDNRGTADEEVDLTSTGKAVDLVVQVSSYVVNPSRSPYVLRVELDPPLALPTCTQTAPAGTGTTEAALPTNASIPGSAQTLILFDEKRLGQYYGQSAAHDVYTRLQTYAARSDVNGVIVPVEADGAVAAAYNAWDGSLCSPAAANDVVRAIGSLLDRLQAGHPNLKSMVIVGDDTIIPFARLLDQTQQANELGFRDSFGFVNNQYYGAVAGGYLLSDDPYGDPDPQAFLDGYLYVPKLALGRLVESPADIDKQLDAYQANNGLVNPQTKLVSGYDFLTDGSQAVESALGAGRTEPNGNLIGETWTAQNLRDALFPTGTKSLIDSINAHYDQHRALSAQGNTLHDESSPYLYTTTDVKNQGADPVLGRIIFTMGCHAGFSLFDSLSYFAPGTTPTDFAYDWPQAYMAGGAIEFMGNTGFGLGDTAAVAYSERLNQLFAQRLDGTMSVGEALEYAKQEYYGGLGIVSTYDAKVGHEATLYGIPTYRLGTGTPPAGPAPAPTHTDPATGLTSVDFAVNPNFTLRSPTLPNGTALGSYYTANDPNGANDQVTNRRPIEPLTSLDVTEPGTTAHGVLLTSLASHDVGSFQAAFGRVADDQSTIEPQLTGIVDFPASIQSLASIATPDGPRQRAVLIAGHFTSSSAGGGSGTQRLYDSIGGTVLYSTSADFVRPTITNMQVEQVGSTVAFTEDVADFDQSGGAGSVVEAIVLYLDGSGTWKRANLTCAAGHCSGGGPLVGTQVSYISQVVDLAGNVGINANKASVANVVLPSGSGAITISVAPGSPSNGWYTTPVTATLASATNASLSFSLDGGPFQDGTSVPVDTDGLHVLAARGSDGSEATFLVPVDLSAPTISITSPVDGSYHLVGDAVPAQYTCADAGSGIAPNGCVGTVPAGSNVDTSSAGSKTFSVHATDGVGHTATASVGYVVWKTPGAAIVALLNKTLVDLGRNPLRLLVQAALTTAVNHVTDRHPRLTCAALNVYIALVNGAPPRVLSDADKQDLIADAKAIQVMLGC